MTKQYIICFPHQPSPVGGPGTFQTNIESFLIKNGHQVVYSDTKLRPDLIFVVAGTRKILWLFHMKLKGVKILHRLDGMNWKFKYEKLPLSNKLKQILQNFLIFLIRNFLADHIIYQSKFIESWWTKEYGKKDNNTIIVNGSSFYEESKKFFNPKEDITLTCVEGAIQNDDVTREILSKFDNNLNSMKRIKSIEIFGDYSQVQDFQLLKNISFKGSLKRESMKHALTSKKRIFFLLELNPPCPNSMIEALSLGIPCIGFNSGSFAELLDGAGIVLPYDADVWKLETPNMEYLIESINDLSSRYNEFSQKAHQISSRYDLSSMCQKYINIIHKLIQ